MLYKLKIFILGFIVIESVAFAQSPTFKHYTVDNGLPSSEVYHVIQDKKGYIWFATNIGVSRFDGYTFENFDIKDGLPDNTVFEIFEDYKERLWFIPFSCKLSYYYNDSIYKYRYNDSIQHKKLRWFVPIKLSFYVDSSDNIYLGVYNHGLFKISSEGQMFNIFNNQPDIRRGNLVIIDRSKLLFSTNPGIGYHIKSTYVHPFNIDVKHYFLDETNQSYNRMYAVINSKSLILVVNEVFYRIAQHGVVVEKEFRYKPIWLSYDSKNYLWIGTLNNGVVCTDAEDLSLIAKYHWIKDKSVSSVFEEMEGGYWFTTLDDGVYYLPDLDFQSYTITEGLPSNIVNAIGFNQQKEILIGTNAPILTFINDDIRHLQISGKNHEIISSIAINDKNEYWIGTNYNLYSLTQTKNLNTIPKKNIITTKNGRSISTLTLLALKNRIYVGTNGSLIKIIDNKICWTSGKKYNFELRVNAIYEVDENELLVGCIDGLWHFKNDNFSHLFSKNELLNNRILDIKKCTHDNKIWLGTKGAGILIMENDSVHNITVSKGITSNTVTSLAIDSNVVWAATNAGLNRIEILNTEEQRYDIQQITTIQGLASSEINQVKIKYSLVYVATTKGLTFFNKHKLKLNMISPPVYITGIQIMDKDTTRLTNYELDYNMNHITINFIGLAYKNAGNLIYEYKMEGIDKNRMTTKSTYVRYPSMQPGKYNFKVKAFNEDGISSAIPATVNFRIIPPFWRTWWFITLFIIGGLLIIYAYFTRRLNAIRYRNQLKEESFRNMQKALSAQLNPHFIFNSLNSIQSYIINNDKLTSNLFLTKFASLMRKVLDNSQNIKISLKEEIETLTLYIDLEKLRFEEKFDYSINIPEEIYNMNIQIPPLLFQPYIENAILHGLRHKKDKGHLKIEILEKDNQLISIIEDNGIGREKAMEINRKKRSGHQSYGVEITEKRMELQKFLHNNEITVTYHDLKDDTGNATGTRVEIVLRNISD